VLTELRALISADQRGRAIKLADAKSPAWISNAVEALHEAIPHAELQLVPKQVGARRVPDGPRPARQALTPQPQS